jgi:uncharacterized protein
MRLFLDSSALAKRYVEERDSGRVEDLLQRASVLGLAVLAPLEVVSALCRRRREGVLSSPQYTRAKNALLADLVDSEVIGISDDVVALAVSLLEQMPLRSSDALHVACAIEWSCEIFASADERQCETAKKRGLAVERVGA